jgi:hypothetical protein
LASEVRLNGLNIEKLSYGATSAVACSFLVASDEASYSTGSEFIADGGDLLGPVPESSRTAT